MKLLLRVLGVALTALLLWLLLRGQDLAGFVTQLRRAEPGLVVLAMAINLLPNSLARARRFQVLLEPLPRRGPPPTLWELLGLLLGSHVASHLLPARAGEALRTVHLHRRGGYPVGALVAAQLVEKLFDVLSMATVALAALLLLPLLPGAGLPAPLRASLYATAVLGAGVLLLLWALTRAAPVAAADPLQAAPETKVSLRERLRGFALRLRQGLSLLRSPRLWLRVYGWSLVADAADVIMVGVCLRALHIASGGPLQWLGILVGLTLLTSVPLTPGQVGVVEAGGVLVLAALGVPREAGLAFGLLYHATHSVSVLVPGALWMLWQARPGRALTLTPGPPPGPDR